MNSLVLQEALENAKPFSVITICFSFDCHNLDQTSIVNAAFRTLHEWRDHDFIGVFSISQDCCQVKFFKSPKYCKESASYFALLYWSVVDNVQVEVLESYQLTLQSGVSACTLQLILTGGNGSIKGTFEACCALNRHLLRGALMARSCDKDGTMVATLAATKNSDAILAFCQAIARSINTELIVNVASL